MLRIIKNLRKSRIFWQSLIEKEESANSNIEIMYKMQIHSENCIDFDSLSLDEEDEISVDSHSSDYI